METRVDAMYHRVSSASSRQGRWKCAGHVALLGAVPIGGGPVEVEPTLTTKGSCFCFLLLNLVLHTPKASLSRNAVQKSRAFVI